MEKLVNGLNIQQACESASKISEINKENLSQESKEAAKRFGGLSVGCLVYAFIYAFCMYQNKEGITFPFFVVATLYFFYYYTRKYCGIISKKDRFLMGSIVILGILTCTTASSVIIVLNKCLILFLMCVLVLKTYFDVSGWSMSNYLCSMFYVAGGNMLYMFSPFFDVFDFIKVRNHEKGKSLINDKIKRIMFAVSAGVVLSIPMLLVIGALLGEADVYFEYFFYETMDRIFEWEWDLPELFGDIWGFMIRVLFMFLVSYGLFVYISRKNGIEEMTGHKQDRWDCIIAITFTSLIGIMYLIFVWIQIAGLFMGALKLPYGYSYAEYARQGFFQLVFVCIFNMILVLVCINCFEKHKVLQVLLTMISICTYVMLVSSAYRMFLYIREYQLTFLRVLVLWGIVVIGLVMAGVIVSIFRDSFPLFTYMVVIITSLYIGFAAIHPDFLIAKYNVTQAESGKDIDEWYLVRNLSLDAAMPVLDMYEGKLQSEDYITEYLSGTVNDLENSNYYRERVMDAVEDMNLRSYNFSKGFAKRQADDFMEKMKHNFIWADWLSEKEAVN